AVERVVVMKATSGMGRHIDVIMSNSKRVEM
ncbi:hypothetical protein Pgy4_33591, partial [Pseudomonas savastanoi pv. glycinea str. race 4]